MASLPVPGTRLNSVTAAGVQSHHELVGAVVNGSVLIQPRGDLGGINLDTTAGNWKLNRSRTDAPIHAEFAKLACASGSVPKFILFVGRKPFD